jgi:hypothetical protein
MSARDPARTAIADIGRVVQLAGLYRRRAHFSHRPVATLRPVTKGAVADVATATGAAAAAAIGVVDAGTGAVRAAIGAVTIANGLA